MFLYSSGMAFTFYSYGDLLLVTNYYAESIRVGDVVVFLVEGRDIHIIHRVIRIHEKYVIVLEQNIIIKSCITSLLFLEAMVMLKF
jgi:hypothetical protein